MYVIVVGCGRVGSQLATFLSEEGHDVAIIDKEPESFKRIGSTFNGLTVTGLGFDQDVLREAGIERAEALAAVTDLDNTNMMAVEVATKIFNVPRAIARLYNPNRSLTYEKLGLEFVCGTTMLAEKLLESIIAPDVEIISTLGNLCLVKVAANDNLAGHTISEIDGETDFKIITIIRGLKNVFIENSTRIRRHDEMIIISKKEFLPQVERLAQVEE